MTDLADHAIVKYSKVAQPEPGTLTKATPALTRCFW